MLKSLIAAAITTAAMWAAPFAGWSQSAEQPADAGHPAMLILDYSNSMWAPLGDGARMTETRRILRSQMARNADAFQNMGLIAYGHREPDSCSDMEVMYTPGQAELADIIAKADSLTPTGATPLTSAVSLGAETLGNRGSIILMTDGVESCGLNPCRLADQIASNTPDITVHVIAIGMSNADAQSLACLPNQTGGLLLQASDVAELETAFATTRQVLVAEAAQEVLVTEVAESAQENTAQDFRIQELEAEVADLTLKLEAAETLTNPNLSDGDPEIENSLVARIAELESLIARLELENNRLADAADASKADNEEMRLQLTAMTRELENARMLVVKMQEALNSSEEETGNLAASYSALLAQLETLNANAQVPADCSVMEDQLTSTQTLLNEQVAANGQLRDLLARGDAPGALSQCEAQIGSSLAEIEIITGQMQTLLDERLALLAQNAELKENLEKEQSRRINAIAAFGEQDDKLADAQAEIKNLQDTIIVLNGDVAKNEELLRVANRTVETQRKEIAALELELHEAREGRQDEIDTLNVRLAELRASQKESEAVAQTYTQELSDLKAINESLQATIHQIQTDNADKDVRLSELQMQNAELLAKLNEANRISEGHRLRAEQFELYIANLLQQTNSEDTTTTTTTTITPLPGDQTEELAQLRARVSELESVETTLRLTITQHEGRVADLENELSVSAESCGQVSTSFEEAQNQVGTLMKELSAAQNEAAACRIQLRDARAEIPSRKGPDTVQVVLEDETLTQLKTPYTWEYEAVDGTFQDSSVGDILTLRELPGEYRVRLLYGDKYFENTFQVQPDKTTLHILRVRGGSLEVRFEEGVPPKFMSQSVGVSLTNTQDASQSLSDDFVPGRSLVMPLAPGDYSVNVRTPSGDVARTATVHPGEVTQVILPWDTALARIKFVDFQTEASITAPVHWRIFRGADLVLTGLGDVDLPLPTGNYRVEANVGGVTTSADFTLQKFDDPEIIVPFDRGQIDFSFVNVGQPITDRKLYWYLYPIEDGMVGTVPVESGSAEDTEVVVKAGSYALDVHYGNADPVQERLHVPAADPVSAHIQFEVGLVDLKSTLSDPGGIEWTVELMSGASVLRTQVFRTQGGDLSYALKPGGYRITASAGGQTRSETVTVVAGEKVSKILR